MHRFGALGVDSFTFNQPSRGGGGLGVFPADNPVVRTTTTRNTDGSTTVFKTTRMPDGRTQTVEVQSTAKRVGTVILLTAPAWGAALYAMAGGFR